MSIIAKRIKEARESKGMTKKALKEALNIKSQTTITNWENGYITPNQDKIKELSKILDVSEKYLAGYSDFSTPINTIEEFINVKEEEKEQFTNDDFYNHKIDDVKSLSKMVINNDIEQFLSETDDPDKVIQLNHIIRMISSRFLFLNGTNLDKWEKIIRMSCYLVDFSVENKENSVSSIEREEIEKEEIESISSYQHLIGLINELSFDFFNDMKNNKDD
ncbi:helix-turn-helix domain-containing protein [Lactococcus lactis]|uniref:helix-turn-helix domain-containing protein n=1 Tax=Lactococcus lactis TaxID=1358 RepID=UPI00067D3FFF|nr:helix-turn-helix transcriptional regulator [Lactococcus lactis]OJH46495.1 hypothetical protein LGL2_10120 [Lactococcus lactis subsp. lactis bv. diacetylactis]